MRPKISEPTTPVVLMDPWMKITLAIGWAIAISIIISIVVSSIITL